jgi:hypothetical protein
VLASVSDALTHDHDVRIPKDCVASQSVHRLQRSLQHFAEVMKVPVLQSSRIRLRRVGLGSDSPADRPRK